MRIGLISDTHGHLDPAVPRLLAGVDHILHAGDIGLPWLLLELGEIAPVTAVLGNNDAGLDYRETELVTLDGLRFLVHHIVDPHRPGPVLESRLRRDQPHAVIFGHTHRPFHQAVNGVLFLNPGYAGRPRFGNPRTVCLLHVDNGALRPEFLPLDSPPADRDQTG